MRGYMRRATRGCNMRRAASCHNMGRAASCHGRHDMRRRADLHCPVSQPAGSRVIRIFPCNFTYLHFAHLTDVSFQAAIFVNCDPVQRAVILFEDPGYRVPIFSGNRGAGNQDRMCVDLNVVTGGGRLLANCLAGQERHNKQSEGKN